MNDWLSLPVSHTNMLDCLFCGVVRESSPEEAKFQADQALLAFRHTYFTFIYLSYKQVSRMRNTDTKFLFVHFVLLKQCWAFTPFCLVPTLEINDHRLPCMSSLQQGNQFKQRVIRVLCPLPLLPFNLSIKLWIPVLSLRKTNILNSTFWHHGVAIFEISMRLSAANQNPNSEKKFGYLMRIPD